MALERNQTFDNPPLISTNIRGAVYKLLGEVDAWTSINAWQRYDFGTPVALSDVTAVNASEYRSDEVFTVYRDRVDWTDREHCRRALQAMSVMIRRAKANVDDYWNPFWADYEELERACREDGFTLEEDGTITQADVIDLEDLDLSGLKTTDGLMKALKTLNRALTADERDTAAVVSAAKELMEAVAASVLKDRYYSNEQIDRLQFKDRCIEVQNVLGVTDETGAGVMAGGLNLLRKGLNQVLEGVRKIRSEEAMAGHGNHRVGDVSEPDAQLAVDTCRAWCRYVLELHRRVPEAVPF
ncbi:abortive infection family protein [Corynebacterium sp.]|uniref:abortive infection family protein n=1 Tax=Corynebacterium sp. TaxID=1720 RepID=UPI0028A9D05E|nr:abortive infection family protein [Corynebacterium sp.]